MRAGKTFRNRFNVLRGWRNRSNGFRRLPNVSITQLKQGVNERSPAKLLLQATRMTSEAQSKCRLVLEILIF